MPWWYAVTEAKHELQNPTSADKIRLLGERLGLGPSSRVLDIASGKGGPARILARRLRLPDHVRRECAGVRRSRARARPRSDRGRRGRRQGLPDRAGRYDAALCIGASFAYGGLLPTLEALAPAAPLVAVGEPYWREWPLPGGFEVEEGEDFVTLPETVARIESTGVEVVT